jgi:hypothetical protein
MALLVFTAVALALAFWVLLPLFRSEDFRAGEYAAGGELRDLDALRSVAMDTLRDLEFDYRMGKMAEKDYQELKTRYASEAAEIVRQIEALEERLAAESRSKPRRSPPGKALR